MNESLADHERVRRCVVLDRLFSLERGELTRTLKLRREVVEGVHRGLVCSLYETAVPQAI
jgi:long-chain acyl-CoA synthetase